MLDQKKTLESMKHKLIGRSLNDKMKMESIAIILNKLFVNLCDEGEPHATKVVRTHDHIAPSDTDDIVELLSSFTK